jgi:hypothetical protein
MLLPAALLVPDKLWKAPLARCALSLRFLTSRAWLFLFPTADRRNYWIPVIAS